jgi:hypothetical protein
MTRLPHMAALMIALLTIPALGGCNGYAVRGKVVRGPYSLMTFVEADDARLGDEPIPNVQVIIHRDPGKLSAAVAGRAVSAPDGSFSIALNQFGAGWMEEQWLIEAKRPRFQTAEDIRPLPRAGERMMLLIMLAPGLSSDRPDEDLMKQYERFR